MNHYLQGIAPDLATPPPAPTPIKLGSAFKAKNSIEQDVQRYFRNKVFASREEAAAFTNRYMEAREGMMDLQVHEALIEMVVAGIAEMYYVKARNKAERKDILKHKTKYHLNIIGEQLKQLRIRTSSYERSILQPLIATELPSFVSYYTNVGTVASGLRFQWLKDNEPLIVELYMAFLRMYRAVKNEYADILACLGVVDVLCQISKLGAEQVYVESSRIMREFSSVARPDVRYCEIISKSVNAINGLHVTQKNLQLPVRKMEECSKKIDYALNHNREVLIKVASASVNDYYRFCFAYIVHLMQIGKFEGTNRRLLREDLKSVDKTGFIYVRCCKDFKYYVRHLPVFDDVDDLKDAISEDEYTPHGLNALLKMIADKRKYDIQ